MKDFSEINNKPFTVLLKQSINLIREGVLITTAEQPRTVFINQAFTELLGYAPDQVIGRCPSFLEGPETNGNLLDSLRADRDFQGPITLYHRDGRPLLVDIFTKPVLDEKGRLIYFFIGMRDVTMVEQERSNRMRLENAIDQTLDAVIMFDLQGRVHFANNAYFKWCNLNEREVIGKKVWELPGAPEQRSDWVLARNRLSAGLDWRHEYRANLPGIKGEEHRFVVTTVSPLIDQRGSIGDYLAITKDITEQKRLLSIAEAHNLSDHLGLIFSAMRHELGNPVNSIKSAMSILDVEDDPLSKRQADYVKRILDEISRVEDLLSVLSNFSLFDKLHLEYLDVRDAINRVEGILQKTFTKNDVALKISVGRGPAIVFADRRGLVHVLLNLLTNAMDAVKDLEKPSVSLEVDLRPGRVVFFVRDNGVGISKNDLPRVMMPFFTNKPNSSGLGLAITNKLVSKMGGTIEIDSTPGGGTTICIEFDAAEKGRAGYAPSHR